MLIRGSSFLICEDELGRRRHVMDVAGLELRDARRGLRHGRLLDLVDQGVVLLPVVRVALEGEPDRRRVLVELIRAVADHVAANVERAARLLRQDDDVAGVAAEAAEVVEDVDVRLFELDHERARVRRRQRQHRRLRVDAVDHLRGDRARRHVAVVAGERVVGVHGAAVDRRAVVELDALPQLHRDRQLVGRDLPGLGEVAADSALGRLEDA